MKDNLFSDSQQDTILRSLGEDQEVLDTPPPTPEQQNQQSQEPEQSSVPELEQEPAQEVDQESEQGQENQLSEQEIIANFRQQVVEEEREKILNAYAKGINPNFESIEDLQNAIQRYSQIESNDKFREIAAVTQKGLDYDEYRAAKNLDVSNLDSFGKIKTKMKLESRSPEAGEAKFNRFIKNNYPAIHKYNSFKDQQDREEWMEENGHDYKEEMALMEEDGYEAENFINEYKGKYSNIEFNPAFNNITEEETAKRLEESTNQVNKEFENFNSISIKVNDKDFNINIDKKMLQSQIESDPGLLESAGMDKNGIPSNPKQYLRLHALVALDKAGKLGEVLGAATMDSTNEQNLAKLLYRDGKGSKAQGSEQLTAKQKEAKAAAELARRKREADNQQIEL